MPGYDKTDREGRFRLAVPTGKGKVIIVGPMRGYDIPSPRENIEGFFKEIEVVAGKPAEELKLAVGRRTPEKEQPLLRRDDSHRTESLTKATKAANEVCDNSARQSHKIQRANRWREPRSALSQWFRDPEGEGRPVQTDQDGQFLIRIKPRPFPNEIIVAIQKELKLHGHVRMPDIPQTGTEKSPGSTPSVSNRHCNRAVCWKVTSRFPEH